MNIKNIKMKNMKNFKLIRDSKILLLMITGILSISLTSCKKDYGETITKELNMASFDQITNETSANIIITYGEVQKVEVTGSIDIVNKRLRNKVKDYDLHIDLREGVYQDYELSYRITMPIIRKADIDGSGSIIINDFDQTDNIFLNIDGSGSINFNNFANISELNIEIDGSGSVNGLYSIDSLPNLNIDIDGSGSYNSYTVKAINSYVTVDGSGSCSLYTLSNLEAKISGSGNIYYKGTPSINANITGSGDLYDRN